MCGRFTQTTPAQELKKLLRFVEQPNLEPRYNIAPTQDVPVLRQRRNPAGERTLQNLRWGLVPPWAEDLKLGAKMINARAETLFEKPAFRKAARARRCIVPTDGFYEWQGEGAGKQPYFISRRDRLPFAFAGVWERWTAPAPQSGEPAYVDSFSIVTTDANAVLKPLHHRMPVILSGEALDAWLDPGTDAAVLPGLLRPAADDLLDFHPVGREVNAARAEGPGLPLPVEADAA